METGDLAFVTIEPIDESFMALVSLDDLLLIVGDPESILHRSAKLYGRTILLMRSLLAEIQAHKACHKPISARLMWKLGDAIFHLREELETLSLQLNGTYEHLVRDLGVKREWLEKPVIFRRYVPKENLIPETLSWGRCRNRIRKAAEQLCKGLPVD